MAIDWYNEFVDLEYTPAANELVALFSFEPAEGIGREEAIGRIASESSTGTWTTLFTLPPRMKALQATAFSIEDNYVKIAYPLDLWEEGNVVQLLSGIAGNIFGMKALANLRLIDAALPPDYLRHFEGPHFGMDGIRDMMGVYDWPLTGAVPKPKVGFTAAEHAEIGFETWMGGFDFVKDDENLTSMPFNRFDDRVRLLAEKRDKAEQETGEAKSAFINITAETEIMKKRADMLAEHGWTYAMIDVVVAGTAAVATMRDYCSDLGLAIHAHRAMHAAFDRNPKHGIIDAVPGEDHAAHRGEPDPYRYRRRQARRDEGGGDSARGYAPGEADESGAPCGARTGLGSDQKRIPGLVGRAPSGARAGRPRHLRCRSRTCS